MTDSAEPRRHASRSAAPGSSRPGSGPPPPARGPRPVAGLLLAAGGGRRLGNRPKALLRHPDGALLVERAAAALHAAGCAPVVVVLGAAADRVRAEASFPPGPCTPSGAPGTVLVENADWATGMGSSLRTGLDALGRQAPPPAAALVSLVDQPGIGPAALSRVLAAYRSAPAGTVVTAAYRGRRGHPVLLPAAHWAAVAAGATGDRGARAFLRAHEASLTTVDCTDVADPGDLDTPEDVARLAAPGAGNHPPEA